MNIVHVNTHDFGGAAIAAHRLHCGLVEQGINSNYLVLYNSGKFSDTKTFLNLKRSFFLKKLKNKILGDPNTQIQKLRKERGGVSMFSSPDTIYDLTTNKLIVEADIIHLHWISHFVDYFSFFRKIGKPIIWTFHDENPFMGGCHLSIDTQFISTRLLKIEKLFLKRKMESIKNVKELTIICPSAWMKSGVDSSFYKSYKTHKIFNGLSERDFTIIERNEAREKLNIKQSSIVLCCVADDLNVYHKGFDIILSLLDFLNSNKQITLLLVGALHKAGLSGNVIQMGKVTDRKKLNLVYSASDALLFPSRQDNLPNVLIESLYCGTPALCFSVGGVPEIIQDGSNGLLTDELSVQSFKKLIVQFLAKKDTFSREEIRSNAVRKFSLENQVKLVTNLYRASIKNSDKI